MSKDIRVKKTVEHTIAEINGKFTPGQSICCTHQDCQRTERIANNNFHHRLPDEVLRKKFQQRGWVFKKGWLCPEHARRPHNPMPKAVDVGGVSIFDKFEAEFTALEQERLAEISLAIPAVAANNDEPLPQKETATVTAIPTPIRAFADLATASIDRMTTSDKRRVFSEIAGNWDEDKGRYVGGSGDQTVASKLNVARAWVEHVRKEFFGESGGSEEIDELRDDLLRLKGQLGAATDDAMKIALKIEGYFTQIKAMEKRLERVEGAVGIRR